MNESKVLAEIKALRNQLGQTTVDNQLATLILLVVEMRLLNQAVEELVEEMRDRARF